MGLGIIGCEEGYQIENSCFHAYLHDKKPNFSFWKADGGIQSDTELLPNTWTHVSFTYDAPSHTASIFINGKLDKQIVG